MTNGGTHEPKTDKNTQKPKSETKVKDAKQPATDVKKRP
jgi:hypothetical protein